MSKKNKSINKKWGVYLKRQHRSRTTKNRKTLCRPIRIKIFKNDVKKTLICKPVEFDGKTPQKQHLMFWDVAFLWQKANANCHKGSTVMKYDDLIVKHILPELGGLNFSEINTGVLADFMNGKLDHGRLDRNGGLSASYVRSIMLIVFQIINFAVNEEICPPIKANIRKPVAEKNEFEILDISSQLYLENQLIHKSDETSAGILISLNTGLRISEVCALKWEDIGFDDAVLHVRSTVSRVKNTGDDNDVTKLIIDKPKTKSSLRDIPISQKLMGVLIPLYERRKSEYVISDKSGFLSPRTYEYRFHKILADCNMPHMNYHTLRHTFATRCIEFGVDVKTLSEILGHSNVSITLNTYVHSSMEHKREQLDKLLCV